MRHYQKQLYKRVALIPCFMLIIGIIDIYGQIKEPQIGNNPDAGSFMKVGKVNVYYESYGKGEPLVILHGNGNSIKDMKYQISFFAQDYHVIAIDSRGRGKSELGTDSLTYDNMAGDVAGLLEKLGLDSAYVLGYSDGGIIALIMGINFPKSVKKIAVYGVNITPDTNALFPSFTEPTIRKRIQAEEMLAKNDTTKNWKVIQQRYRMVEFQPRLSSNDLGRINVPVLVLSADRDIIKPEHTLFIYKSIPKANLCIFPDATHRIPREQPELFNKTIASYFKQPFRGVDIR
ncbi:MAG: alpha/beta hydrolase [Rikenellaceae bacterium]|nr:alpha/beta hydrolase [Rikenellaceae bacterium]